MFSIETQIQRYVIVPLIDKLVFSSGWIAAKKV